MTNIGNSIQQVLLVTCGKCYIQECNWIGSSPNVFAWKKAAPVSLVKILSSTPPLEAELLNFRDSSFTEIVSSLGFSCCCNCSIWAVSVFLAIMNISAMNFQSEFLCKHVSFFPEYMHKNVFF